MKKLEQVRHVSSPILKVITIQRLIDELMGADSECGGECLEADKLNPLIFYIICSLKSNESPGLGARFIEECTYIDSFLHEEQLGLIMQYTNVEHFKMCFRYLEKGLASCEKNFINKDNDNSDASVSSDYEDPAA